MKKRAAILVIACAVAAAAPSAKGRTVKLAVSGPTLNHAIDVTTADAVAANPWLDNFTDHRPAPAPDKSLPRFEVAFYEELPSREVKKMYVVTFAYDRARRAGFVYFPGPDSPWYRLNVGTIYNEEKNGTWQRAFDPWSLAISAALPQ